MKKLIINADDFGWSRENVDAIIALFNAGVVSSTSIMATMPAFGYGIERLTENGGPEAGVHLSLFDGCPVLPSGRVPGLADPVTGRFFRFDMIYRRMRLPKVSEIEAEFRAQIERVVSAGIKPTHLDVHMTLPYYLPSVYSMILSLNSEYGLPARTIVGTDLEKRSHALARRQHMPAFLIRRMGNRLLDGLERNNIKHPDFFIPDFSDQNGSCSIEEKAEVFRGCLENLEDGVSELLTHPSSADEPWRRLEYGALKEYAPGILRGFPDVKVCGYSELD